MMTNLFSIFDPSTHIMNMHLNWLSTMMVFILLPFSFWFMPSRLMNTLALMNITLKKEFSTLLGPTLFPGATLILLTLFIFIMSNNVLGLMPYIFTSTSHPLLTVTLALPLWVMLMLFGWVNHTTHMLAHLVPQGTPPLLTVFMVCIESVSNLIRPLTLSVRLAANMIAGHLLLTLLGGQSPTAPFTIFPFILTAQLALLLLESAVALIQAYVFSVLTTLYISESSYDNP